MTDSDPEAPEPFGEQFLDDYFAECDEHVTAVRRHLLALDHQIATDRIDMALLDELFRSFHTIKGISGMVGFREEEQLAHRVEDTLRAVRQGSLSLNVEVIDGLIESVTFLERRLAARRSTASHDALPAEAFPDEDASTDLPTASAEDTPATAPLHTFSIEFTPTVALSERGININSLRAKIQEIGEIVKSTPRVKGKGEISFQFRVRTKMALADLPEWNSEGLITVPDDHIPIDLPRPAAKVGSSNVVRVDLARLDELIRTMGEMTANHSRLKGQIKQARQSLPSAEWRAMFDSTQTMARQLRDLRDGILRVRMVQVGEIFDRMQFVVRDMARESGKRVLVDVVGQETEIDKFLIERLMDPLLHLVRNAVSHGLERPDERIAAGKSAEGHLTLRATTSGENVSIEIVDDGRGIDVDRVAERAYATGLLASGVPLTEERLLEVICYPGFSTRTEADRESGRGVGMDVVKSTVEALTGTVTLSTHRGQGSRFCIELPLTLAMTDALIVAVRGQTYAVPQSTIREVLEVEPSAVRALERNEIVAHRGGALPLLRLSQFFKLPDQKPSRDGRFHVFVTGTGSNALGIAVDRIVGHQEIVVRSIGDPLVEVPGIAGATDLGDEKVVLIIDVPALRRSALQERVISAGIQT
jgi:two-component system, chemotaxis family, sensor kinase CheA